MGKQTPSVYPWTSPDGHQLVLIVVPATVRWSTWSAGRGRVEPAEPEFEEAVMVRSAALIEGQFVLNDGPYPSASGDREWGWAAKQIEEGVDRSRPYVVVPPGKRTADASNTTSKWSWRFLDIYDLSPGGVSWAPWEHEMEFATRASAISRAARAWLDDAHPEWRAESVTLGLKADLALQRASIRSLQAKMRDLRADVAEARRRAEVLKAASGERTP